jgi:uncharacterized protein YhaN
MRLTGLHIERFGIWSGLKLERLPKGVCVFYGPNEAGKTTLLQFLRSMLFGYSDEIRDYLPATTTGSGLLSSGSRGGGSLAVTSGNVEYHIRRYLSLTDPSDRVGDLRVTASNSERMGAHRLATLLNGLDEVIFNNVFAMGLRELQQLATLDATEVGRQLYQLSTGTDRVSLVDVTRQLQDVRRRLLGVSDDDDTYVSQLAQQIRRYQAAIQGDGGLARYAHLHGELNQVRDVIDRFERDHGQLQRGLRLAELSISIAPLVLRRHGIDKELAGLGKPKPIPPEVMSQIGDLEQQLTELQARSVKLEENRELIKKQASEREAPATWARVATRLQAMLEQRPAIERSNELVRRLKSEQEEVALELESEREQLGKSAGVSGKFANNLMALESLVSSAEQEQAELAALEQTQQEIKLQQKELERLERAIHEGLNKDPELFDLEDKQDIVAAVKRTGLIAERLKKRHQLEGRRQELRQQVQTAEAHQQHALRTQILPWEVLQAIGVLFAAGVFCLLISLFHQRVGLSPASRTGFAWMGGIGIIVAGSLKFLMEATGNEERQRWTTLHTRASHELSRIESVLDELEQAIPSRKSQPLRLEDAQARLTRLESILPLEEQRRRCKSQIERSTARHQQLTQVGKESAARWQDALRKSGLSAQLSVEQVRKWIGDTGRLVPLEQRLQDLNEQLRLAEHDYAQWHSRISTLAQDAGLSSSDSAHKILDQLASLATKVERDRGQRDALRDQERRIRDEMLELSHEIRQCERARTSLFRQFQAADLAELRQRQEAFLRRELLLKNRNDLQKDIQRALGDVSEAELDFPVSDPLADSVTPRITTQRQALAELEAKLKDALQRKGEIQGQLQALAADRQRTRAQLDAATLDQRLQEAVQQFQVVSAMNHLLKSVYKRYERERQPDTLRDASNYFRRMSSDRYTRIWTPLAEDVLLADEATGRTIPVTQLSSGTREQVYLSLRLAMAANYARRGVQLPLILDDVLVNFDVDRTRAAAEVLIEFAHQGHQVLLFTCHQHVTEIFKSQQVEVRELPRREYATQKEPPRLPSPVSSPKPSAPNRTTYSNPFPVSARMILGFSGSKKRKHRPPVKQRPARKVNSGMASEVP